MIILSDATARDIDVIMQIERSDGYERQVGRWEHDQHLSELSKRTNRYLVGRDAQTVIGFAILQGVGGSNDCILLRRIAVRRPGRGDGSALLRQVLIYAFGALAAHRVELRVFTTNGRAHRAYLKSGFVAEGILRDLHKNPDGSFASMMVMSILRPEWLAVPPE